jgi:hypothetical protein
MRRAPEAQAQVWRQRVRSFGLSAIVWLVLGVVAAASGSSAVLVGLAFAASALSAAVVVKGLFIVRNVANVP